MMKRSPKIPKWQIWTGALRSFSVPKDANKLSKKKIVGNEVRSTTPHSSTLDCTSLTCSWLTSDEEEEEDFSELCDFYIDEDEYSSIEAPRLSAPSIRIDSIDSSPSKSSKVWDSESSVDYSNFDPKRKSTPVKRKTPGNVLKENDVADYDHGGSFIPKLKEIKSFLELEVCDFPPENADQTVLELDDSLLETSTLVDVVIPENSLNESNSLNTTKHSKTICTPKTIVMSVEEGGKHLRNIPICDLTKPPNLGRLLLSNSYSRRKSANIQIKIIYRREPSDLKDISLCCLAFPPSRRNLRAPS